MFLNATSNLFQRSRLRAALLALAVFSSLAVAQPAPAPLLHRPAPNFVRRDITGSRIELRRYRGKVVLLNFWATWCAPCRLELPRFAAWQRRFGPQGFQVVAVSMDDSVAPVRAAARRMSLNFPVISGDARLGTAYGGVLGLPVTFLIARNGTVVARLEGDTSLDALGASIERLLREK